LNDPVEIPPVELPPVELPPEILAKLPPNVKLVQVPDRVVIHRIKCMNPKCTRMCFIVAINSRQPNIKGAVCSYKCEAEYSLLLRKELKDTVKKQVVK